MDNISITTERGYTVTLKPFLTYDDFIEVQKLWTSTTELDPNKKDEKPTFGKIPANMMYEANALLTRQLVISIVDKNGKSVERQPEKLPLPPADGQEVMEKINELYQEAADAFDKKKLTK